VLGAAVVAALGGASASRGQQLLYDGDGIGPANGGSGVWDLTSVRWSTAPGGVVDQTWVDGSDAVFSGPGGVVTVNSAVTLNSLTVTGGNYFFRTSVPTFNNVSGTVTVNVGTGADAVFNVAVAGTQGFTKTGAGSIGFVSNVITSGIVDIQQGTVYFKNGNGELTDATVVNVGANGVLDLRNYNESSFGGVTGTGIVKLGTPGYVAQSTGSLFGITYNDASTTQEFAGTIQGFGFSGGGARFIKQGTGTVRFSGSNNQWGLTSIRAGTLEVINGTALPDLAPVSIDLPGSTLRILSSETVGSIGTGPTATGGLIDLTDTGTVTFTIGADGYSNMYRGSIAGTGTIVKIGPGIQTIRTSPTAIATVTTYTGKYRIEGGTLSFNSEAAMGTALASVVPDAIQLAGGTLANTTGGGMTLSSNRGVAVLANSGIRVVGSGVSVLSVTGPLSGTNTLTKTGPGILDIGSTAASMTYSGDWTVQEGAVRSGVASALPLGTGSVDITGGAVQLKPGGTGVVAQTLASEVGGTFAFGPSAALEVARGGNTSYTLTLGNAGAGSFLRKADGSLVLVAKSGVANLGNPTAGERVLVTGGVTPTNGIVPGVVAVGDHFSSQVGDFVGYDPVAGFQKSVYTSTDLSTSLATHVVEQSADVTLAGPVNAYALKVGTGAPMTVTATGQTINVGSGMVILNDQSTITGGTLALGAQPGILHVPGNTATLGASVTGSGSLQKIGRGTLTLAAGATMSNTGPTIIGQGALTVSSNDQLSAGSDLVFYGPGGAGSADTTGTVSRLNLNGTTQHVKRLVSDAGYLVSASTSTPPSTAYGPLIDFGLNGVLVVGSGDSTYKGGAVQNASSTTSTLWKDGTGVLTLGETQVPDNAGITSAAMSYSKLWITGGGTVSVASTASIPNQPGTNVGIVPDVYKLDGGTLRVTSVNLPNLTGSAAVGSSAIDLFGARRGITIGTNGGTIEVSQPLEILLHTSNASNTLYGTGVLTKAGPGIYRPGTSNPNFTGKTVIKQGTIQITGELSLGTGTGNDYITLDGGGIAVESNSVTTWNTGRGMTVTPNGGEVRVSLTWVLSGPLTGTGPIKKTAGGAWVINAVNSGYSGDITFINGTLDARANSAFGTGKIIFDPQFPLILSRGLSEAETTLPNDMEFRTGSTVDIRPTSPLTLTGKLTGPGSFFKGLAGSGPNDLKLTNSANDFTGDVTAIVGSLIVTADHAMGGTAGATIVHGTGQFVLQGPTGGTLNYSTPEPLYISGSGSLGNGAFQSTQGTNTFAGTVHLMNDTSIGVPADSLELTGPVVGKASLTKKGTGRLTFSGVGNNIGGDFSVEPSDVFFNSRMLIGGVLNLPSGSSATLTPGNRVLRVGGVNQGSPTAPETKLDLTDGKLIVDYSGTLLDSPIANIRSQIIAAYNLPSATTHWDQNGITSSTAAAASDSKGIGYAEAADVAGGTWQGEQVDGTTVLVRYTLLGDATLDGQVNFNDLVQLAQSYNVVDGTRTWFTGDFTYDGNTDFNDLVKLAQNYNTALPSEPIPGAPADFQADLAAAFASVPEPGSLALLALGGAAMLGGGRRRRRPR
jgi:autotransporter-associated beta strand protein